MYQQGCFGCGAVSPDGRICASCRSRYAFDGAIIAADYDLPLVSSLVKGCKYRFVREVGAELADIIIRRLEIEVAAGRGIGAGIFSYAIIPVPLSRRRSRWRGFNQAEEIGERISRYFSLPVVRCLTRTHRPPQAKLAESDRLINLHGAFTITEIPPKRCLLIDDVMTTGSTAQECAKTLRAAGAEEIWIAVVAKG